MRFFEQEYAALEIVRCHSLPQKSQSGYTSRQVSFVKRMFKPSDADELDPGSDVLVIHRLIQDVLYGVMENEEKLRLAHSVATGLNNETDFLIHNDRLYSEHSTFCRPARY